LQRRVLVVGQIRAQVARERRGLKELHPGGSIRN
jgi:hypothetical protein